MSTLTTRLGLYKPAASGSELVNVVTDLNNNLDSLDAKVGAFACTSGTRPGSPFNGQMIRETDTGKLRVWDGAAWTQVLYGSAEFGNGLTIRGFLQADDQLTIDRPAPRVAADHAVRTRLNADTASVYRFLMQVDGKMFWGDGTSSGDTNLYRSGANTLKTDDSLQVVGALNVTGAATLTDLDVTSSLDVGSARIRPLLSSQGTVANTTSETVIAALTIPANDGVVGAVYKVIVRALGSVTATPTLTIRARIGGVAGALITTSTGIVLSSASNASNHPWHAELYYTIVSTGAGGTGRGHLDVRDTLSLGGNVPFTGVRQGMDASTAAVAHDTTAAKDLVITVQWSAASTLNTTTVYIAEWARVA